MKRLAPSVWQTRTCQLASLILLAALAPACGYHVAGKGNSLPPTIKTIAIPVFVNESVRFRIEQKVAAAVTREFIERTPYEGTEIPPRLQPQAGKFPAGCPASKTPSRRKWLTR